MSSKRFVDFVSANLVGKKIARAFVDPTTALPRIVFSDSTCVEVGSGFDEHMSESWSTITTAESVPADTKVKP